VDDYGYVNDVRLSYAGDDAEFSNTMDAMDAMGFELAQTKEVFQTLAALLALSDVTFEGSEDSSHVPTKGAPRQALELGARLLGVDSKELETVLTTRRIEVRGEVTFKKYGTRTDCGSHQR